MPRRKGDYNAVMKPRKSSNNRLNVSLIFSDNSSTDFESADFFTIGESTSLCSSTLSPPASPEQRKLSSVSRQSFASTPFTVSQPSSPASTLSEQEVFDPSLTVIHSRPSETDSNRISVTSDCVSETSSVSTMSTVSARTGGARTMKPQRPVNDPVDEKESPFMRRLSSKQRKPGQKKAGPVMTPNRGPPSSAPATPTGRAGALLPSERTLKRTISNSSSTRGSSRSSGPGSLSRRQSAGSDKGNTLTRKRVGSGSVRERSNSKTSDVSLDGSLPPVPPERTASIKASEVRTLDRKFSKSRGSIPVSPEPERRLRGDSTVVYNDFEEMEALMLQQEELNQRLEQERQEKEQLEKERQEQLKKEEEMAGTIKTLEEEIVNVDCQMLKMKAAQEELESLEDLADHKRGLQAKLTMERGKQRVSDDLISISGMSIYSEHGLLLSEDISDYSKRDLLDQVRVLKREKTELEGTLRQVRMDCANEKRKQDKVIKDLMTQIRGFHMPAQQPTETTGPQETMALITDLRHQLEQMTSQNKSQTKLIERLVSERNHHLLEIARLKGNMEEATQLRGEVS